MYFPFNNKLPLDYGFWALEPQEYRVGEKVWPAEKNVTDVSLPDTVAAIDPIHSGFGCSSGLWIRELLGLFCLRTCSTPLSMQQLEITILPRGMRLLTVI